MFIVIVDFFFNCISVPPVFRRHRDSDDKDDDVIFFSKTSNPATFAEIMSEDRHFAEYTDELNVSNASTDNSPGVLSNSLLFEKLNLSGPSNHGPALIEPSDSLMYISSSATTVLSMETEFGNVS